MGGVAGASAAQEAALAMPRTCTICSHPQRADIDKALVGNESNRDVSNRFGPSVPALQRHRAHHLPQVLARAQHVTLPRIRGEARPLGEDDRVEAARQVQRQISRDGH